MIKKIIIQSIETKKRLLEGKYINQIEHIADTMNKTFHHRHKVLVAGNGGSAADAQHFVAELINKFEIERQGLPAIALTTNSSVMTSIANDTSYNLVFSRQIETLGQKGDIFFAISTSGNSPNIILALKAAQKVGLLTIGLLGKEGGKAKKYCDLVLIVPSKSTPRIQESHQMIFHILCQIIDRTYNKKK
jgi:D-sedoheptulose 7-phosphate isomerase